MADSGTLLVVEDDPLFHRAIARAMERHRLQTVLTGTGAAFLSYLEAEPAPVAAIVDLGLPDCDGTTLIRTLRTRWPDVPVLVLSGHQDAHQIDAAFDAGATGYLLKTDLPGRLASAIDEMLDKGVPMSARVSAVVLERARRNSGSLPPLEFEQQAAVHAQPPVKLSRREREVVTLLVAGHRYDGIAAELGISVNTVRSHIRTLYEKLGAQTKVDAVMAAVRMGIVEDVPPRG